MQTAAWCWICLLYTSNDVPGTGGLVAGVHGQLGQADVHAVHGYLCHGNCLVYTSTADVNELKNVELMSLSCPIRYIITVNALKEGWDLSLIHIYNKL